MRIAPRTLRTMRTTVIKMPMTNTSTGHVVSEPPWPRSTIVPAPGVTKPASTKPMKAMNRPMPTLMAVLSHFGTALNTARRKPVRTSSRMMTPSMTTIPIASCHDQPAAVAIE